MRIVSLALLGLALTACGGTEAPNPAPTLSETVPVPAPTARVFFVEPVDGAEVTSPVKVVMGVEGMTVRAAGELVEGTGHHHIIVDAAPTPEGEVVPATATHIHYGQGQTETELALEPGARTLHLQFADGMHQSYGASMRASITIHVAGGADEGATDE